MNFQPPDGPEPMDAGDFINQQGEEIEQLKALRDGLQALRDGLLFEVDTLRLQVKQADQRGDDAMLNLRDAEHDRDTLYGELDACAAALPGPYYMDPPDGGSVSVSEQVRRMARHAAMYRWFRDTCIRVDSKGVIFIVAPGKWLPEHQTTTADDDAAVEEAMKGFNHGL